MGKFAGLVGCARKVSFVLLQPLRGIRREQSKREVFWSRSDKVDYLTLFGVPIGMYEAVEVLDS